LLVSADATPKKMPMMSRMTPIEPVAIPANARPLPDFVSGALPMLMIATTPSRIATSESGIPKNVQHRPTGMLRMPETSEPMASGSTFGAPPPPPPPPPPPGGAPYPPGGCPWPYGSPPGG